jgi:hypothetical protein
MTSELMLRRKWTLRAHGKQVVFVKKTNESAEHVIMKALLWALYLPDYPEMSVEIRIGDRYKPDVVALDNDGKPRFWGESGQVGAEKIRALARRYRATHFAIAKWDARLDPFVELVKEALDGVKRSAPFDLIGFPADSVERFIDDEGQIQIRHDQIKWMRL